MPKSSLSLIASLAACFVAPPASAATIDLLLDIQYAGLSSLSGGDWRLLARTDGLGLRSLQVPLTGVNADATNELPVGLVNGSDNAGFASFATPLIGQNRLIIAAQSEAPSGNQQGVFYGVGTLQNGSPVFPARPSGTSAIGPNITSLAGVQNIPWGTEPVLLSSSATVASGTFAPGVTPAFGTSLSQFDGRVFTALGTIVSPGPFTDDIDFTTEVLTNLDFGVPTGDYNNDGLVNAADYTVWQDALGATVPVLSSPDGNADGEVTRLDRLVWANNYGLTRDAARSGAPLAATAIPEPTACVLALLAAATPGACRRSSRISRPTAKKDPQSHGVA